MILIVEIQDGFEHDTLIARVSGAAPVVREDVTTDLRISRAGSIEVAVIGGDLEVEIEVSTRGLVRSVRLSTGADPTFLLVNRVDDALELRATTEQPYYM